MLMNIENILLLNKTGGKIMDTLQLSPPDVITLLAS